MVGVQFTSSSIYEERTKSRWRQARQQERSLTLLLVCVCCVSLSVHKGRETDAKKAKKKVNEVKIPKDAIAKCIMYR